MGFVYTRRSCGCGLVLTAADSNRRMRENRTSGGVGGVTGAIPLPRPDRRSSSFYTASVVFCQIAAAHNERQLLVYQRTPVSTSSHIVCRVRSELLHPQLLYGRLSVTSYRSPGPVLLVRCLEQRNDLTTCKECDDKNQRIDKRAGQCRYCRARTVACDAPAEAEESGTDQ